MSSSRQSGSLGQALAIVALSLSGVALALAIVAVVLATVSRDSDGDAEQPLADRYEYTVYLVNRAIDFYEENVREATLEHYNSPESVDGPRYVFIYDEKNIRVAHPTRPDLLGKPVDGPSGVDINGYAYGQVIAETGEAGQWVDYVFLNPKTGNQEYKHSWFRRHEGLLFGSGWYQVLPTSPLAPSKADPADYSVALVDRAIRYYKAHGLEGSIRHYSSPDSVDGTRYVFMFDENNIRIAHPTRHDLLGQPVDGPTGVDINGYAYGPIFAQTDEGGQWVDYVFLNPATGEPASKHTWLKRYDGIVFASGWYE